MSYKQVVRDDAELGRIRFCRKCAEWWPDDDEFWITRRAGELVHVRGRPFVRNADTRVCRACASTATREWWVVRQIKNRQRTHVRCATPECLVLVPIQRGRCHGCERRTIGPLTIEQLREWGLAVA